MNQYNAIVKTISMYPEKVALRYFGIPVSYSKFGKMIETAASGLYNMGVRSGDVVCVALPSTPESIATLYALNKIGAVASTIDVRFTASQVASIVNALHARVLFIMNFNVKCIAARANEMGVEHIVVMRGCELFPKKVSSWYAFGELFNGRRRAYNSVGKFMHWSDLMEASHGDTPRHNWMPDSPQMIFQTSGTTGGTKSVMITAENIEISMLRTKELLSQVDVNDTVLCLLPIFAFYGFLTTVHLPLTEGMTIAIVPIWKAKDFIRTIARLRPQHVFTAPSSWDAIYDKSNMSANLSDLKTIVVAGDVIRPDFERDINEFLHHCGCGSEVTKVYGMTETAGIVAYTQPGSPHKYQLGFSGVVAAGFKIKIVDEEICVTHPTKLLGYYGNIEATNNLLRMHEEEEAWIHTGCPWCAPPCQRVNEKGETWIHTGDSGNLDDEGNLYVTGRIKRMIVRFDGTKIFPIEIEDALMRHTDVLGCAVVACKDKNHPQSCLPVAFCVVKRKGRRTIERIMRYVSKELPVHLHPARIITIDKLPVLGNGKVNLVELSKTANGEK